MGIFDGVLISSDFDGTLFDGEKIAENNITAIRRFIEGGGHFTISSGRQYAFVKKMIELCPTNTYIIALNGALIANPADGSVLYEGFIDGAAYEILDAMLDTDFEIDRVSFIKRGDENFSHLTRGEYKERAPELRASDVYDLVFHCPCPSVAKVAAVYARNLIKERGIDGYTVVRSFSTGVEILKLELTKGVAARRVAKAIGAHTVIGVGDFENDIPLIKEADVGYAVAGAVDELKAVADRITVGVCEGALASVIEELERELLKR